MSGTASYSASAKSGTVTTVKAVESHLEITDFYFREFPKGSESAKGNKYISLQKCRPDKPIDRKLRTKAVITWAAAGAKNNVNYKIYIIGEDGRDVPVKYDDNNNLPTFSFFGDDEFHNMDNPEGSQYWELWNILYSKVIDYQKLDLIPVGTYKCKIIIKYRNEEPQEWTSENSIKIIGDPPPKELTITDFYFRELSGDIPTDKESERRAKYIKMPVCDDSVPIDRRLREKALITWVAAGTRDDIKYKMYIIAEGEKDVLVKYDDKNSLPSFSFFKDDEFHPMNDAEGPHYWELWKVYYNKERKCQKLDLLPAGIYKCKMITQHKDEKPQEWISKNNIKIIGNPFCVTITCTAMDNNELAKEAESASKSKPEDVHYLDNIGRRIAKDSNLKVYRGDYDSDSVLIGRFKALMMPTQLNYVATPKGRYFGYRDRHKNEYACIELESEQIDSGNGTIILPEDCINPDTGGHYKDDVQIHKNPNKNQDFVSGGLSQGCIVVPEDIYSKDDDIFKNRQNNPDGNPPHYNSILMTAILGGYDEYIIPRFDDHKRKLQIQIILNEPVQIILNEPDSKVNSRYLMMHSDIVQDIVVKKNSAGLPEIVFYAPQGVFRDYYGGQYLYDVLTCAKLKLFIAKDDEKGGYAQIRLLYMGKLVPGKRAYSWDGYDSPPKTKNRKLQQAGKYFLVMESTFTPSPPNGSAPEERTIERKNPWVFEEFEIKAIA